MSDTACREAWLAAGEPGEPHSDGILFSTWEEAIVFGRAWAEAYRQVSLSCPGFLDWSYYPYGVRDVYEVRDLCAGPVSEHDEMSQYGGIRQVRIAWVMQGLCRRKTDDWSKPDPWRPIRPYSTGIHVIAHVHKNVAWAPKDASVEGARS